ncbi:MAG: trigger factor [Candidatus Lambdaproteobacteria bacterium RIFOXYD12_FULL_49_8]|uniref:Trigger factor n=1 Tax=Candidatus Lambdaproteobacteria bacterium RIFOXYD2_FULL_50_16 TaxID=1817772 RepID=A0A1F6GDB7_9PROT|nr:MAG: trigger factor [Candidatus Lambdaproteobacteria bacterium RIFOXYD2_FULL_50_16]OGG98248.1 MAG: trigger factor [Candidatus Lambdaproteobacteria bacterium RIFOXYD12_FULL_49_8]
MENLNVAVEDLGNLKRRLTVTVPQSEVNAAYDKVYNNLKGRVRVNGFRKGKMPQALLEKRFSQYMKEEAMETLVPRYFQQAVEQEALNPALQPEFSNLEVEKTKPFVFTATVEVWPNFDLPKAASFSLEKVEPKVEDSEKEQLKRSYLVRQAQFTPKEGAAALGDSVKIDFSGKTEDGEEVNEQGFEVSLGDNQLLPEFEAALTGMKAGDEKEFEAQLPADHPEKRFRGQKASFKVKLLEVQNRVLPQIDEAFLKQFGEKAKTPEAFEQMIENELKATKVRQQTQANREKLREQIAQNLQFPLPEGLMDSEVQFRVHQIKGQADHAEKSEDELKTLAEQDAQNFLRTNRFVHLYMKETGLTPKDDEVWRRFVLQCQMMGQNPGELVRTEHGRQFYNDLFQMMAEEAVLDHIASEILK